MKKATLKIITNFILIIFIFKITEAQDINALIIKGEVKKNNELEKMKISFYSENFLTEKIFDKFEVKKNKSVFKIKVPKNLLIPFVFGAFYNGYGYKSNYIFLDSLNNQFEIYFEEKKIKFISKSISLNQKKFNTIFSKYQHLYKNSIFLQSIDQFKEKYKILNQFIQDKTMELPIFWIIVEDFFQSEQSEDLTNLIEEIANKFSADFKKLENYKIFKNKIEINKKLFIGKLFPTKTYSFHKKMDSIIKNSTFTLIDYWTSWCTPCIQNTPSIVKKNNQYKNKGFNTIGISVYTTPQSVKSELIIIQEKIKKYKMDWNNFNDFENKSNLLNIHVYPTYIILNNKGEIVYSGSNLDELLLKIDNLFNKL